MQCQACKKTKATVRCTSMVNNKKSESYLCEACAEKNGVVNPLGNIPELFGHIMASILGEALAAKSGRGKKRAPGPACPSCGLTFSQFEERGKVGCAQCYKAFSGEMKILLRRLHGSSRHKGRAPRKLASAAASANLPRLRRELQEAILQERFERAAELRNIIRAAETTEEVK
jgi:protein arginine kinase activator